MLLPRKLLLHVQHLADTFHSRSTCRSALSSCINGLSANSSAWWRNDDDVEEENDEQTRS